MMPFASIKRPLRLPEYPDFPMPQHLTGLGFFELEEQRHEHEARVHEWEQQRAEWRANLAEHIQKRDAALSRFKHFEDIGRNIARTLKILSKISRRYWLARIRRIVQLVKTNDKCKLKSGKFK